MSRVRIAVSKLDSFAFWLRSEQEVSELVDDLLGKREQTAQMEFGIAYDEALSYAKPGAIINQFVCNGVVVPIIPNAHFIQGMTQVPTSLDVGEHLVTGRIDNMVGIRLYDDKLSKKFNPEKYFDSLQWRTYLLATGADSFTYRVAVLKGLERGKPIVEDVEEMTLYPYDGMMDVVEDAVDRFVYTAARLGLTAQISKPGRYEHF